MNQNNDIVQNIKDSINIVDHIQKYISLKQSGRDYLGICPFHDDHKPSMRVSPDKQLYHCFSCGNGGDVIGFHMNYNNLDFRTALKELAASAGIQLENSRKQQINKTNNEIFFKINNYVLKVFRNNLNQTSEGKKAFDYLINRGLEKETIEQFCIGYSMNDWNVLCEHLGAKKVPLKLAEQLGLIIKSPKAKSGYYDRFRGRIIFPIFDLNNKVAGFGGRTLFNDDAKYLNSPESPLYNKSRILYGLSETRNEIRKENRVIIVEGYLDLLSLYQHGIKNVVATLGTALTSDHAKILKRFCENMVIVYDGDNSGVNASLRALEVFLKHGISPHIVQMTADEDPSSLVEKIGAEGFAELVQGATPLIDYYFKTMNTQLSSGQRSRNGIINDIVQKLSLFSDSIDRSFYIKKAAEMFGLREQEIYSLFKADKSIAAERTGSSDTSKTSSYEFMFLKVLLHYPSFIEKVGNDIENIARTIESPVLRDIIKYCVAQESLEVSNLINHFDDAEIKKTISSLLMSTEDIDNEHIAEKIYLDSYKRIKLQNIKREQKKIKSRLENNASGNESDLELQLLKEYDSLVKQEKFLSEQVYGA